MTEARSSGRGCGRCRQAAVAASSRCSVTQAAYASVASLVESLGRQRGGGEPHHGNTQHGVEADLCLRAT
ncbi:hypothetical protein [Demequina litorisediminis]|uniref:hypothetical protein n=1 Tax=Demequina litorisediminis TaxID=1849022 RepID=UPI0024E0751D|nr:hypothetical protein [Demequina litorisediminis]